MFKFAKRIALFLIANILITLTISFVLNLLGVRSYMTANGIDYNALLIFCLVWGFAGSLISLLLSRFMAKWMMGVKVINPTDNSQYQGLVQTIHSISRQANLAAMPEVGVYDSPEINAFATGPSERFALVAVSTGLLSRMNRDELEGVLAHEIAHIKNGDMVTMTLLQGLINAFVMFLARVIAFAMSQNSRDEGRGSSYFLVFILEIVLSLLGMIVVMWFSRYREFRADAGSAKLVGTQKMIAALEMLKRSVAHVPVETEHQSVAAFKINGGQSSWINLFASHPPLEKRIEALRNLR